MKLFGIGGNGSTTTKELETIEADLSSLYENTAPQFNLVYGSVLQRAERAETREKRAYFILGPVVLGLIWALVMVLHTGGNRVVAVPVNKDGVPVAQPHEVTFAADPTVAAIQNRLSDCVVAMYSVSVDAVVNRNTLSKAYACVGSVARGYLDSYYGANSGAMSPYVRGHRETVEVTVAKIETLSQQSYHVLWTETERTRNGTTIGTQDKSATFSVSLMSGPRDIADIVANPFGIVISTITPDANLQTPTSPALNGGAQ
jgi:type IV secretory pathway TrbF-like protein